MTEADRLRLRGQIKVDEGFRGTLYRDSEGYWTIGYGRLLEPSKGGGISKDEAEYMLANDLARVERECVDLPAFDTLSGPRQAVLVNMCFNLGKQGLLGFKRTFAAIVQGDYDRAASQMLGSKWAGQVGVRAVRLAEQMKTGQWA